MIVEIKRKDIVLIIAVTNQKSVGKTTTAIHVRGQL